VNLRRCEASFLLLWLHRPLSRQRGERRHRRSMRRQLCRRSSAARTQCAASRSHDPADGHFPSGATSIPASHRKEREMEIQLNAGSKHSQTALGIVAFPVGRNITTASNPTSSNREFRRMPQHAFQNSSCALCLYGWQRRKCFQPTQRITHAPHIAQPPASPQQAPASAD